MKDLWFKHSVSMSSDPAILELKDKFGFEGYGVVLTVLELLRINNGELSDKIDSLHILFGRQSIEKKKLSKIIKFSIKVGIFFIENEKIRSAEIDQQILEMKKFSKKFSEMGKKSQAVCKENRELETTHVQLPVSLSLSNNNINNPRSNNKPRSSNTSLLGNKDLDITYSAGAREAGEQAEAFSIESMSPAIREHLSRWVNDLAKRGIRPTISAISLIAQELEQLGEKQAKQAVDLSIKRGARNLIIEEKIKALPAVQEALKVINLKTKNL